jgi:hypothetical protein
MEEKPKKSPPLTVFAEPAQSLPEPPQKLGPAGNALWSRVQREYAIRDVGGQELLVQACLAADRADALAAQIDADGERIVTKTGIRDHPLLRHELAARAFVVKTLQKLGITDEPIKAVGHPTRSLGWTPPR